jgi:hypothetical protein
MWRAPYSDPCVHPSEMKFFRGFSTPFHIEIWNFPWGFSELNYTSCSWFIVVTPMVPELRALGFFFYYKTYACNSFPGVFFSTPFHIRTWNFLWSFSEWSYTSSSCFIFVTTMVPELLALGFLQMHAKQFSKVFFYTVSYRNLKLSMKFFWVQLHIEIAFHRRDHNGSGVTCPWIFYYRAYSM